MRDDRRRAAWTPGAGPDSDRRGGPGTAPEQAGPGKTRPAETVLTETVAAGAGLRWTMSLRALVVLLAMAVAAAGMLWFRQAGTAAAAGQLASQGAPKVAVPPLTDASGSASTAGKRAEVGPALAAVPTAAPSTPVPGRSAAEQARAGPLAGNVVVVHVAGAVAHPGVYTLPSGSRIQQAVKAAGGALPEAALEALNLAAVAADGTQILVPTRAQVGTHDGVSGGVPGGVSGGAAGGVSGGVTGSSEGSAPGAAASPVDVNSATLEQLDALPGVGPVLAGRIVAWRTDHGPFTSVEELDAVSGIGAKMLANLRPLVIAR